MSILDVPLGPLQFVVVTTVVVVAFTVAVVLSYISQQNRPVGYWRRGEGPEPATMLGMAERFARDVMPHFTEKVPAKTR